VVLYSIALRIVSLLTIKFEPILSDQAHLSLAIEADCKWRKKWLDPVLT